MSMFASDAALKDSGTRKNFDTGAHRDNSQGKGRYDLLPPDALLTLVQNEPTRGAKGAVGLILAYLADRQVEHLIEAARNLLWEIESGMSGDADGVYLPDFGHAVDLVAKHFEKGAIKYAARNWEKGIPVARYIDSTLRHTFQYLRGDTDEPHLIAAAWNVLALIQTLKWIGDGVLPASLNDLPVWTPSYSDEAKDASTCASPSCACHLPNHLPEANIDAKAEAAYAARAEKVYGQNLTEDFVDEKTLDGSFAFTATYSDEMFWWDAPTNMATFNAAGRIISCHYEQDSVDRYVNAKQWTPVKHHPAIVLRAFVPTNKPRNNAATRIEFYAENGKRKARFLYAVGDTANCKYPISTYEGNPDYQEVATA